MGAWNDGTDVEADESPARKHTYKVVHFINNGVVVHCDSDDEDGAHRVAKAVGGVVLHVSEDE